MALQKRFPKFPAQLSTHFYTLQKCRHASGFAPQMQDAELVDRDGTTERVQIRQAAYLRSPTRIAWNLTSGISQQAVPFRALLEANFTFRPEFIDHSLNPLHVFGAGEGGSTQLYPLAEFELVISGKRFVSGWQSLGHGI
jgi:hypothetical protein